MRPRLGSPRKRCDLSKPPDSLLVYPHPKGASYFLGQDFAAFRAPSSSAGLGRLCSCSPAINRRADPGLARASVASPLIPALAPAYRTLAMKHRPKHECFPLHSCARLLLLCSFSAISAISVSAIQTPISPLTNVADCEIFVLLNENKIVYLFSAPQPSPATGGLFFIRITISYELTHHSRRT